MILKFQTLQEKFHIKESNEQVRYPGQRSQEERKAHLEKGVDIPEKIWFEILAL
jgi:LDH2 family malate/lactate/ureidoglycolate dehydrogenase